MKNSLDEFKSRLDTGKGWIGELEDNKIGTIQTELQRRKKTKKKKRGPSPSDLWNNNKLHNICIIEITEKGEKNVCRKKMKKNTPKLTKK